MSTLGQSSRYLPHFDAIRGVAILGVFLTIVGVDIAESGENPEFLPFNQLCVQNYDELVLLDQGGRLEQDPEVLRLFIGAL